MATKILRDTAQRITDSIAHHGHATLERVQINNPRYNKGTTTLCFIRQEGCFYAFVEPDLQYLGESKDVIAAFGAGVQKGWRQLLVPASPDLNSVLVFVDGLLGLDGSEPRAVWKQPSDVQSEIHTKISPQQSLHTDVAKHNDDKDNGVDKPNFEFVRNITAEAQDGKLDPFIGRKDELLQIETILCKGKKRNAIIIGDPGVGKTALVEGLAVQIATGMVPEPLAGKEIWELNMADLTVGAFMRGEFEQRLKNIINIVLKSKGKIILFIDEIHTILGAGNSRGGLDAANILKPHLTRGDFQCIGATTEREYREIFEKDKALNRRFQKIDLVEPDVEMTKTILMHAKEKIEEHHSVLMTEKNIEYVIHIAKRYVSDRKFPDKALDLLDESCARCRIAMAPQSMHERINDLEGQKYEAMAAHNFEKAEEWHIEILRLQAALNDKSVAKFPLDNHFIDQVVSKWTGIPVEHFTKNFKDYLAILEKELKKNLIGQDEALQKVIYCLKKASLDITDKNRPHGVFLFHGPTGVGKTEMCRVLAKTLFGTQKAILRFDMSEFHDRFNVSRLIGSPPGYVGYDEGGQLTNAIRRRPFSLVVFDEVEKAHPDVFDIFLQIFEEGELTDGRGEKADFSNTIIVMTSNIQLNENKNTSIGFNPGGINANDEVDFRLQLAKILRPELVNRIDHIIRFRSLEREYIAQIVELHLERYKEQLRTERNIDLQISDDVLGLITYLSYSPEFGAREVKRQIQQHIINKLVDYLVNNPDSNGQMVIRFEIINNRIELISIDN